jgi:hypothetical protein
LWVPAPSERVPAGAGARIRPRRIAWAGCTDRRRWSRSYDDGRWLSKPHRRSYRCGLADMTTYPIASFWQLAIKAGLKPESVELMPKSDFDKRYAYFLLDLSQPRDRCADRSKPANGTAPNGARAGRDRGTRRQAVATRSRPAGWLKNLLREVPPGCRPLIALAYPGRRPRDVTFPLSRSLTGSGHGARSHSRLRLRPVTWL